MDEAKSLCSSGAPISQPESNTYEYFGDDRWLFASASLVDSNSWGLPPQGVDSLHADALVAAPSAPSNDIQADTLEVPACVAAPDASDDGIGRQLQAASLEQEDSFPDTLVLHPEDVGALADLDQDQPASEMPALPAAPTGDIVVSQANYKRLRQSVDKLYRLADKLRQFGQDIEDMDLTAGRVDEPAGLCLNPDLAQPSPAPAPVTGNGCTMQPSEPSSSSSSLGPERAHEHNHSCHMPAAIGTPMPPMRSITKWPGH